MSEFVRCQIRIPVENLKKLKFIAKKYNCSVNELVIKLLEKDFAHNYPELK